MKNESPLIITTFLHNRLILACSFLFLQPIVIDNGSGMVKAGFAGDHVPKHIFPNFVGRPKHVRVMAGALEGDVFLGIAQIGNL